MSKITIKFLSLLLIYFSVYATAQAPVQPNNACPLHSSEDWQAFLKSTLDTDNWVQTCEDSTCDKDFFQRVQSVSKTLSQCRDYIESRSSLRNCTERLLQVLPTWIRQHDNTSYGFDESNASYLRGQQAEDIPPGMMQIPQPIIDALPDQKRVQETAAVNGWRYLTHDSAISGIRTFIYIPDPLGRFDQWMILNLKSATQKTIGLQMPVSLLAVQKKNADGSPLANVRLHFRDYALDSQFGKIRLSVNENGNGKCFSCHVSGMRQLIPRQTAVLEALPVKGEPEYKQVAAATFARGRLIEFNKIMRRYGSVDWNGKISLQNLGPALGQAQGCTSCHNGITRGQLSIFTSSSQLKQKVLTELSMPPTPNIIRLLERSEVNNPPLRNDEEKTLAWQYHQNRKIVEDYLNSRAPTFREWVLNKSCIDQKTIESQQHQTTGVGYAESQRTKETL